MRQHAIVLCAALAASSALAQPPTLTFRPKHEELTYTFGGNKPVRHVAPGTRIVAWTEDCYDGAVKTPSDLPSKVTPPGHDNPQTGPFYVDGAEPGDVLAVRLTSLSPARDHGISAIGPGFGALTRTDKTAMLGADLPESVWWYAVDRQAGVVRGKSLDGKSSWDIPLAPFLGCLGVAPGLETRSSITPAEHGGNMDAPEASAGNTAYFPVNVRGALLFLGDGHAQMGDGEIAGTAIEVPMRARLQVSVIKGQKIAWPRFENIHEIMALGAYRPLDDALRIAFTELIGWIHAETGLSELDAYQLLSQVGKVHVTEMVDPNYVVIAGVDKKYLPRR